MAQRITRLPTEQKIPGSNPGRIVQWELIAEVGCMERWTRIFEIVKYPVYWICTKKIRFIIKIL